MVSAAIFVLAIAVIQAAKIVENRDKTIFLITPEINEHQFRPGDYSLLQSHQV